MKKSTIGILVTSLLLILIGGGLFVGGILAVGGIEAAQNALARHGVYIENGVHIDINRSNRSIKYSDMEPMYFAAEDIKTLKLEAGAADVEVVTDDSVNDICIRTDGNYDVYMKDNALFIKMKNKVEQHSLRIELPSDMVFDSVDIEAGACAMEIESLKTKVLDAELGAGELIINQLDVQKCELSVGMGNAVICLEGRKEDYNYDIECGAGNVDIGNESFGGLASERKINNYADASIDIECGMGNVTIDF